MTAPVKQSQTKCEFCGKADRIADEWPLFGRMIGVVTGRSWPVRDHDRTNEPSYCVAARTV
jgi:hypothetical protein